MKEKIVMENFYFTFPGASIPLINGANLRVNKGTTVALVGLSGSGKTTLSYCISGIYPHIKKGTTQGTLLINGKPVEDYSISGLAKEIGVIFQNPENQLFLPTVEDEIAFGPENLGWKPERIRERIGQVCKMVGIEKLRHKNPKDLSGGEKQLVAIGAVLSLDPGILIFDEAMSQLDEVGTELVKNLIRTLKNRGKTIVMIEHNPEHFNLADEIFLLNAGRLETYRGKM